ncbi:MAG: hypothetical protein WCP87_01500 [Atribacterota bacterium]
MGMVIEQKDIWVLTVPDNQHYRKAFAISEIKRLSERWEVAVTPWSDWRDCGHGMEQLYTLSGAWGDMESFELELSDSLC